MAEVKVVFGGDGGAVVGVVVNVVAFVQVRRLTCIYLSPH